MVKRELDPDQFKYLAVVYASYGLLCAICFDKFEESVVKSLGVMMGTQFGLHIASKFMDNSLEALMVKLGSGSQKALQLTNTIIATDTNQLIVLLKMGLVSNLLLSTLQTHRDQEPLV